jgi:hypothetical protein
MAPTPKQIQALCLALTIVALSSCGKDKSSSVSGAGEKQVAPQDVSAARSKITDPLTSIIRGATVEKTPTAENKYAFSVGVDLEQDGKTTSYLFRSEEIARKADIYGMGSVIKTRLCEDLTCNRFASDTTHSPISIELHCNSSSCDSSFALVHGVADPFRDSVVSIEHQLMENLEQRFVGSSFIQSTKLNQFFRDLDNHAIRRTGTLEVTRVLGTPIESIKVSTQITPLWYHSVFTQANANTDVTKLPQYFITTIGAVIERDAKGKIVTQNLFHSEQHPNQNWAVGGFGPGRVKIGWKPGSGQLLVSMQDASQFPSPDQNDGGTLELGYISERLVKPALDDQTSSTVDLVWLFQ